MIKFCCCSRPDHAHLTALQPIESLHHVLSPVSCYLVTLFLLLVCGQFVCDTGPYHFWTLTVDCFVCDTSSCLSSAGSWKQRKCLLKNEWSWCFLSLFVLIVAAYVTQRCGDGTSYLTFIPMMLILKLNVQNIQTSKDQTMNQRLV